MSAVNLLLKTLSYIYVGDLLFNYWGVGGLLLSLISDAIFPPLRFIDKGGGNIFNNISDVLKPNFYYLSVKLVFKELLQAYLQMVRNELFNYC